MIRTQIQLTEEQTRRLRTIAAERGVSMAELVRQGVDLLLRSSGGRSHDQTWEQALAVVGRFDSGCTDVSAEHDRYLDEAYRS